MKSVNELIEAATNRVVVTVGRKLLNGNVLLLSNVHDLFCSFATELLYYLNEEIVISLITSAYILSSLTASLQLHIEYCCKTKKYGTLLYRPNTDLKPALAQSLWQLRQKTKNESDPTSTNLPIESVEEQLTKLNSCMTLFHVHVRTLTLVHQGIVRRSLTLQSLI